MTINELREKRNNAWNAAKAFVETKRDKDGLLSEEDAKTYAQMEKKVQDYGAEIERMEAMSAMEAQLNRPTSSPITDNPMTSAGFIFTVTASDEQIPRIWTMTGLFRLSGLVRFLIFIFRFFNC